MAQSYAEVDAWILAALQRQAPNASSPGTLAMGSSLAELQLDSLELLSLVIDFCQAFKLDFDQIVERDFRVHNVSDLLSYARLWSQHKSK